MFLRVLFTILLLMVVLVAINGLTMALNTPSTPLVCGAVLGLYLTLVGAAKVFWLLWSRRIKNTYTRFKTWTNEQSQ